MTLWMVRAPTTASLQTILILALLVSQPADLLRSNVGTVLFGPVDTFVYCLDKEKYASLIYRQMLHHVVVVPLKNAKGDEYIYAFVSFVYASAAAAETSVPPPLARAFISALFDVAGGYLRSYLLPVTREAFYAGNVRFADVQELFALYDEIKDYLHTNGNGWALPKGEYGILHNVRSIDITFSPQERDLSCDNFLFNDTSRTGDDTFGKSGYIELPVPFFDDNRRPASIAFPLRHGAIRSILTPESAYIIVAHYVKSVHCLLERGVSAEAFIEYNRKFRRWLVTYVLPRLGDEQWYPAFGGILRVLRKTGECMRSKQCSRKSSKNREVRQRRHSSKSHEVLADILASDNRNLIAEAVVDNFIPIDIAVLRKLMYPKDEQKVIANSDGWQISILPELMNPVAKNKSQLDYTCSSEDCSSSDIFKSSVSPTNTLMDRVRKTVDLELHYKMVKENCTTEFSLVPSKMKQTLSTEQSFAMTGKTASVESKEDEDKASHLFHEDTNNGTTQNIILGFDDEKLNQSMTNKHESEIHRISEVREYTSFKPSLPSERELSRHDEKNTLEAKKWTSLSTKKQLSNLSHVPVTIKEPRIANDENVFKNEAVNLNHVADSGESSRFTSIITSKLLRNTPFKSSRPITMSKTSMINGIETAAKGIVNSAERQSTLHKMPVDSRYTQESKSDSITDANNLLSLTNSTESHYKEQAVPGVTMSYIRRDKTTAPGRFHSTRACLKAKTQFLAHSQPRMTNNNASEPSKSTINSNSIETPPGIDSTQSSLGIDPHNFQNLTDGCVRCTWDGSHAASPLVSRLLASVLQSPAFNLDFLVCHVLFCLFIWLILLCASIGQADCRVLWRRDLDDFNGYTREDRISSQALIKPIYEYYSLGGELYSSSSGRQSIFWRSKDSLNIRQSRSDCRCVRETATQEEMAPLNEPSRDESTSATLDTSQKLSGQHFDNDRHRLSAGGSLTGCKRPTRCLFPLVQRFRDFETKGSEESSEHELCN